jgi:hypothetical protein
MSTTVTGSPPRGRAAPQRRGSAGQAASQTRRGFGLPRPSTTPGRLWLLRAVLVIACLAWGALATLSSAGRQSAAGGAEPIAAAGRTATAWFAANQRAQQLDSAADYGAETELEIGSGPGTAGTLFGHLESDLDAAINADQAVFSSNAAAGSDAFEGLEAGIVVLALVMAIGCGWGLTRRLAEYR